MGRQIQEPVVVGIDVGSTTVKAVVLDPQTLEILWSDYQRHQTKQPEKVLELLEAIEASFPASPRDSWRVFMTGSGAAPLCPGLGAKFVQEVNAVTLAVENLHPDVGSVIELGGQDAKIIIFQRDEKTGDKTAAPSMNDKCASGTGATIDKCMIKVGLPPAEVVKIHFDDSKLHHVAAKCGVFAETDIVNLVKSGIPSTEILCSLADAIVLQNLSVLTRGSTLKHKVILLGGPNTYLPFLQECWRKRIPETWDERGYSWPKDQPVEETIFVPDNAQYYAAFGACVYGLKEAPEVGRYAGKSGLVEYMTNGRKARLGESAGPPLVKTRDEVDEFRKLYSIPRFTPMKLAPGQVVRGVIGLDGGSTSSKAVLIDEDGNIVCKAYQLSKGNPIQDAKELLSQLRQYVLDQGATLEVLGFGGTGYAADVLQECMRADVNIVETVAHMMSAVKFFGDVDVICDIGGQDIKVLFMKNGDIANFRLSNSCSAGNGMLLQAMADQFGLKVTEYADTAFGAELAPKFSYGCAVFLDTDRVNFQKEGFSKEELLAGLAQVLPKNVWQYVVQIPRLAALGTRYVLQGGTQYNLAAVKAQVDYIKERVPGAEVFVHPHTGEAGALGAAFETLRVVKRKGRSTFIGIDAAIALEYTTKNDEETVCHFCPNECKRTFIDTKRPDGTTSRYISGFSCEKGTVESEQAMLALVAERKKIAKQFPNLVDYESKLAFRHFYDTAPLPEDGAPVKDTVVKKGFLGIRRVETTRPFRRSGIEVRERLRRVRIGIPRVLNIYSTGPYYRAYFEALGIPKQNVVFSDATSEEMWVEGGKYGSIDPCFPSKVAQAHVHNLLFHHHTDEKKLHYIFFPILTHVPSFGEGVMDKTSCPIVAGVPDVMKAAFTKEVDFFKTRGIEYLDPALTFSEMTLTARRMFETWGPRLGITEDESDHAHREGMRALSQFERDLQDKGRAILETVESENRVAILMIGRPYHSDPGLNHGIPEEFQVLGYPILSVRSIPRDMEYLARYFKDEIAIGQHPLDINDVWPENYSANSAQKVWAAKFAARHPNVVLLDLSSFKCGHDAPTYGIIDSIVSSSATPYAALHDIDANKPGGSIKIRVKTYAHSLKLHEEALEDAAKKKAQLVQRIEEKRLELLQLKRDQQAARKITDPALEREIAALAEKVRSYVAPVSPPEAPKTGLVQIKKKQSDGTVVPLEA
ncbi:MULTISPECIES: BadF/BadG/BcrA/BcrD ATPase family protein [Sorangium]|uniref:CoA-substrate-specific enzyme activase domain protein n=1 Tax=Sorangium cellulosum (strain So ce56) TaxID=448385 RepID=A9GH29_SORC5|nr:BadF/BadG/BcrA/BcrD ATPase family protein [Sorangium cellulosum]CAN96404.1 CoA-substrate-specific enzyme activase domain protein [Sorangium cellulosum So ce56]